MTVNLTPETERILREIVAGGAYANPIDAVREGLLLLRRRESLRHDVAVGIAQADAGDVAPLDIREILQEGRRTLRNKRESA